MKFASKSRVYRKSTIYSVYLKIKYILLVEMYTISLHFLT